MGRVYPTVEHAYQAAKTFNEEIRISIQFALAPGEAKKTGKRVSLRPDWKKVRIDIMRTLLRQKFSNPALRDLLLQTGTLELVEDNNWGDKFWGKCNGVGENMLGKLLMEIREGERRRLTINEL